MKKLLILAAVATAIALCAPGAKAVSQPKTGITTNYTPLNVSMVITTNGVSTDTNDIETQITGQAKISNTTLMKIFAHWAGTNFPTGAKLVIGWDYPWYGDVLVVDKSGTNVLYNTYYGESDDYYFYVDYYDEEGPYSYKDIDKDPGSEVETEHNYGEMALEDDYFYLPYTYLYGAGNSTISYTQHWNADGDYTTWTQSTDMNHAEYTYYDDEYWLDEDYCSFSGSANSSGSGKGEGYYFDY